MSIDEKQFNTAIMGAVATRTILVWDILDVPSPALKVHPVGVKCNSVAFVPATIDARSAPWFIADSSIASVKTAMGVYFYLLAPRGTSPIIGTPQSLCRQASMSQCW